MLLLRQTLSGKRTVAVVPLPDTLASDSVPPCSIVRSRDNGNPSPVPTPLLVVALPTCSKGSSTRSESPAGMPVPASLERQRHVPGLAARNGARGRQSL